MSDLDQISRAIAAPVSRRQSLRLLGLGLAAAMLGVPRAARAGRAPRQAYQLCPTPCSATPGSCLVEYTCCGRGKCCPPWMDCFQPCTVNENCVCKPEFVCGGTCCAPPSQMQCVVGICCPAGATNCAGNCCAAGMECVQGELCLEPCQPGAIRCGDLHQCCQPGGDCVDGRCIAPCKQGTSRCGKFECCDNRTEECRGGVCVPKCRPSETRCRQACCKRNERCHAGFCEDCPGTRQGCGNRCCPPGQVCRPLVRRGQRAPAVGAARDLLPARPAGGRRLLRGRQPRAQRPLRRGLRRRQAGAVRPRRVPSSISFASLTAPPTAVGVVIESPA